ncbi:MAG: hypothetical protein EON58_02500 [Alphaproteobacteria bacterium]|nr:MAG: hypothetical protein EON58_02500 [Alphaproteobacteria bacterium]
MMNYFLLTALIGVTPIDEITSQPVHGFCVVSNRSSQDSQDRTFLAKKSASGKPRKILELPVRRYDRNVPDLIYKHGNQIVVLINGTDIHRIPIFIRRVKGLWKVVNNSKELLNPGGNNVSQIDGYLIGLCRTYDGKSSAAQMYVFGPNGLKFARIPNGASELTKAGSKSFSIEYGSVKEEYVWPLMSKNGTWQLKPVKGRDGVPKGE